MVSIITHVQSYWKHFSPWYRRAVLVSLFSAGMAFGYALWHQIPPSVDARVYDTIAMHIVEGYGYRESLDVPLTHDFSIVRAGPAYEYFLAGIFLVFGHSYPAVWAVQALLHGATALLLFFIARALIADRKTGERMGFFAAFLFGISPDLIEISAMLLTETLYLFLVTLAIGAIVSVMQSPPRLAWSAAAGAVIGIAALSRPPVVLFLPILCMWFFIRRLHRPMIFCVLAAVLVLTPWTIRNYRIFHEIVPTTMIGAYNIWLGNMPGSAGGQFNSADNPLVQFGQEHGFTSLNQKARLEFFHFVKNNPSEFVSLSAMRTVRYFSLIRPMGFWFYQDGLPLLAFVAASGIWIAVIFIAGIAGFLLSWKDRRNDVFRWLALLAATAPVPLLLTVVQSRYRFQIYPFFALFAAYLLSVYKDRPRETRLMAI